MFHSSAARSAAEESLLPLAEHSDQLFRNVIDASYDSILITNADLDALEIVYVNAAFCRMTGYRPEEILGKSPAMLQGRRTDPEVTAGLRRALEAGKSYEAHAVNYRKDGTPFHLQWRTSPVFGPDGEVTHYMAVQRDISDEINLIQRLKKKAEIDGLTRLMTHEAGEKDLMSMLDRAEKDAQAVSVLVLDIDHFKAINDEHGHVTGDHVLRRVAQIVDGRTRGNDLAIRWGGEEFVCGLWATGLDGARNVAESIREAVAREAMENLESVTLSCGVAEWQSGEDALDLIERADSKLYEAKSAGRNRTRS